MSDTVTTPTMLRVDITDEELRALKKLAIDEGKTVRVLVGEIIRERLAT